MRIVHVTHQFLPETHGGLESYVLDLTQSQSRAGHDVRVFSGTMVPWPEPGVEDSTTDGIPVRRFHRADLYFDAWDKLWSPEIGRLFRDGLREVRPDIVHVHHWIRLTSDLVAIARSLDLPVVVTLHDYALSCPRCFRMRPPADEPCFRALSEASCLECVPRRPWQDDVDVAESLALYADGARSELALADRVLVATGALRDAMRDLLGAPTDHFEVLPLAHAPRFAGMTFKEPADGPLRFGFWGAITERKGVDDLVEAFRRLIGRRPELRGHVRLELFGRCDTPERDTALAAACRDLPVTRHGRFEYSEIAAAGLGVAVFPSRCLETYGLVLDEACELGLPVIVPAAGALGDRVGGRGLTYAIGDIDELSAALEAMVDPEARRRLRHGSWRPSMTDKDHSARLGAIYDLCVADRGTRPDASVAVAALGISLERRAIWSWRRAERQFRRLLGHEGSGTP